MIDCGFTKENRWFRYRAAAIIVENECALFACNETDDYFYSIGGGVHHGETAEDAVLREVFEETGVHYEIDRLAVIHENFFNENGGTLKGLNCHEISFYFLMIFCQYFSIQIISKDLSFTIFYHKYQSTSSYDFVIENGCIL